MHFTGIPVPLLYACHQAPGANDVNVAVAGSILFTLLYENYFYE